MNTESTPTGNMFEDDNFNTEMDYLMLNETTLEPKKKSNKQKPKEEKKMTGTEQKDEVWNCRFNLSKKLHQQVKLISVCENISIQQVMENALIMYVNSRKKKIDSFFSGEEN